MANNNPHRNAIAPFKAVIQYTFLPDQLEEVVGFIDSGESIEELLVVLMETGYEVSQRYDSKRESYSVCLKGVEPTCVNAGKWMYGNGETLRLAFASAFFKHFEVFRQQEWVGTAANGGVKLS